MGPMDWLELALFCVAGAAAALSLGLAVAAVRLRISLVATRAARDRAVVSEASTMRTFRLSIADLRGGAMQILGHLEKMIVAAPESAPGMVPVLTLTRQLLDLADDMQDHAVGGVGNRVIRTETIQVDQLLDDQIAAVTAILGPSRRHWRVAPDVASCVLLADTRALTHVFARVLGNAARETRDGDSIDISLRAAPDGSSLVITNDGAGAVAQLTQAAKDTTNSRGIRFGLLLAQVLMEAHGGSLSIEAGESVGTSIVLRFPPERVVARDDVKRVASAQAIPYDTAASA